MYQVNFSLWRAERQLTRYRFWRNAGLYQCALLALIVGGILMQSQTVKTRQQNSLAGLLQQQTALSQHHKAVQQTMVRLQHVERRLQVYRQVHQPAQRYSTLLQQLSQEIPNSCWLISVIPQGDKLVFEAISQDYADINTFLVRLGRLPLLANIHLQTIAQRDDGNFRFVAQADWQGGENHNDE